MKFCHEYKLVKDIPGYKKGRTLRWDGNSQRFYFRAISKWEHDNGAEGFDCDKEGPKYTVEQIQNTEWFRPTRALVDFIPPFPSADKLEEFVYLTPDCRLVDDVDECRALNALFAAPEFQSKLYEFYRDQYNAFHGLEATQ